MPYRKAGDNHYPWKIHCTALRIQNHGKAEHYKIMRKKDINIIGIDIGTSACKVALFDRMAATNGDYPVYYPKEGWAEQNPEEW